MANKQQMEHVALQCPGYEAMDSNVVATIGAENAVSCSNCHNWHNDKCVVDLFDKVLESLDQM